MSGPITGLPLEQQPADVLVRMCLWAEARGEGPLGMLAVWHVLQNRATQRDSTRGEEVLRPHQFSWTNPADPNYHKALTAYRDSPVTWAIADAVAALSERGLTRDPTNGADHYLNRSALDHQPSWSLPENGWHKTVQIGKHEFGRCV